MNWLLSRIRRGEGPFWGTLKRMALAVLSFHLPTGGPLRPFWRLMYSLHVCIRESWIWFRRFFWNEPLFRSQCVSVGSGFRMEELPYIQGHGQITIGCGVRLSGKPGMAFNNRYLEAPELTIGDGTFIGNQCSFRVARSIRIGKNCMLAGRVSVVDCDGHPLDAESRRAGNSTPYADVLPVVIGDDVWIGTGALVMKGVQIGDRTVVAARSIVTKDVPPDTVVAGAPAKVVKHLTSKEEPDACSA
jgi:acetyltransferase-like isoleucine patch superfamily enzyme